MGWLAQGVQVGLGMSNIEIEHFGYSADLDPAKVASFLRRERRNISKNVERANAGQRGYADFKGWTEVQIEECAQSLLRVYAHNLRREVRRAG